MAYEKLALLYDSFMEDSAYEEWVDYISTYLHRHDISVNQVLDVACGTGRMALKMINKGYEVTGVDLSEQMLAIAQERALLEDARLVLIQQDMRTLELNQTYDLVTILCDSVNYLKDMEDVKKTLEAAATYLREDGLLIFDVHSVHKVDKGFVGHTFSFQDEGQAYIWDSFEGDEPHSVIHELTLFHETESGLYERFDEEHHQRTYAVKDYLAALNDAGFTCIEIYADFTFDEPQEESERWFFFARKQVL